LPIVLSVLLRFTASDYRFDIFKHFFLTSEIVHYLCLTFLSQCNLKTGSDWMQLVLVAPKRNKEKSGYILELINAKMKSSIITLGLRGSKYASLCSQNQIANEMKVS